MALITKLNNIANAIAAKTGQPASSYTIDNMPTAISSIQTDFPVNPPTPPTEESLIRFIDYDGTVVAEFDVADASSITSLPELPTHAGLTGTGWTETLAYIQGVTEPLDVGAMYQNAADPKQNLFEIDALKGYAITLYFNQDTANGVEIDWGDGSAVETVASTGNVSASHTYAASAKLKLTMTPTGTTALTLGWGDTKGLFNAYNGNGEDYRIRSLLRKAIIGRGTRLSPNVFYYNMGFTTVVLPDSLTEIPNTCFGYCEALNGVVVPNTIVTLGSGAFQRCFALYAAVIPSVITTIPTYCLSNCTGLEYFAISPSVSNIGNYAFQGCAGLAHIKIPSAVTFLGSNVFEGSGLIDITIPATITSLNNASMFQSCTRLQSATFLGSGTIGSGIFSGCSALESVDLGERTSLVGSNFSNCISLREVTIPRTMTTIGNTAFGQSGIESIFIPNTVTTLGTTAFWKCYGLDTITIEDRDSIPSTWATQFSNNIGQNSVKYLDFSDFTQVPTVNASFFQYMPEWVVIKVPSSLEASWKAASVWSTYASQIVGV